jgi:hypothetical protein
VSKQAEQVCNYHFFWGGGASWRAQGLLFGTWVGEQQHGLYFENTGLAESGQQVGALMYVGVGCVGRAELGESSK